MHPLTDAEIVKEAQKAREIYREHAYRTPAQKEEKS